MKRLLPLFLLLAGCGRTDPPDGNAAQPVAERPDGAAPGAGKTSPEEGLAGLYEGGTGAQKNQLCIVEKGGKAEFGLLVWGGNLNSCSGAGQALRRGERLALRMTGDETCTIEAIVKGGTVTLPKTLPTGCAYYCGAGASLGGAVFTRSGDDVKKATDIAGDPLCD